jgi:hypothetical protein
MGKIKKALTKNRRAKKAIVRSLPKIRRKNPASMYPKNIVAYTPKYKMEFAEIIRRCGTRSGTTADPAGIKNCVASAIRNVIAYINPT